MSEGAVFPLSVDLDSEEAKQAINGLIAQLAESKSRAEAMEKAFVSAGASVKDSSTLAQKALAKQAEEQKRLATLEESQARKREQNEAEHAKRREQYEKKIAATARRRNEGEDEGLKKSNEVAGRLMAKSIGEELPEKLEDIGKAFKIAKGGSDEFGGATASMGTRVRAAAAGISMASQIAAHYGTVAVAGAQKIMELAAAQEQVERHASALGSRMREVEASTSGTMSVTEAFTARNDLMRAGIVASGEQLGTLARAGREFGADMNQSAAQGMQEFMRAAQAADNSALAPFHISIRDTGTAAGNLQAALAALHNQQVSQPIAPPSTSEQLETFQRQVKESVGAIALLASGPLRAAVGGMQDFVSGYQSGTSATQDLTAAQREADTAARVAHQAWERQREQLQQMVVAQKAATSSTRDLAGAQSSLGQILRDKESTGEAIIRRIESAETMLAARRRERTITNAAAAHLRTQGARGSEVDELLGIQREDLSDQRHQLIALQREARGLSAAFEGMAASSLNSRVALDHQIERTRALVEARRTENQQVQSLIDERLESLRQAEAAEDEIQRGLIEKENAREEARLARQVARDDARHERALQSSRRDAELAERSNFGAQLEKQFASTTTLAESMAGGVRSAFESLAQGVGQHTLAMIEQRESVGEALKGILSDLMKTVAQEAVVRAVMSTGLGIAALAMQLYPVAAQHFAAAGVFAGVAALAGTTAGFISNQPAGAGGGAAAGGRAGGGSSATSGASVGAGSPPSSGGGGTTVYQINVGGSAFFRDGVQAEIARNVRQAQLDGQLPTGP